MPWLRSLVLVLGSCTFAAAADWPQWLGPTRDSISTEKVAPWKDAPKVLWRQEVGEGHSSPVVAAGRVYLHYKAKDKEEEVVAAFDAKTGKPLWDKSYPRAAFKSIFGNGPRGTPAVVGKHLYTFGVTGVLSCWEADNGKLLWQNDTLKTFKASNLVFGVSGSPLIDGNKVLVNVGGKGASIVAFDKDKGDVLWQALSDKASYSSPILLGTGKDRQAIFLTAAGLVGLSPEDGTVFWQQPLVDKLSESSTTPVLAGNILLGSSVTVGSIGLTLQTKDGKPAAAELWKNPVLTCYFSTPVVIGTDQIYMVNGSINPLDSATLRCIDAKSGKELWSKAKIGKYHAALLRTGDDKLLLLDDAGALVLLDPNPKEYRELARAKVCGQTWAHPALADGRLYLRDGKELICIQLAE